MSAFRLCDGEDCYNTENEGVVNVPYETTEYLYKKYKFCFKTKPEDLCYDCINDLQECMEETLDEIFTVNIDEYNDLILIKKEKS